MTVGAIALVASGAFSIGEVTGAHHAAGGNAPAATTAGSAGPPGVSGQSGLSGLSLSGLQKLGNQVSQAAAIARSIGSDPSSADLSQLEQQLGIAPSASAQSQAAQLQAELNAINACLSGSSSAPPSGC